MKKILILVEGQTEERFVKDIMNPTFLSRNCILIPTIVTTKIVKSGGRFKGGWVSYASAKRDLQKLLGDTSTLCVTTMFDFYGMPDDFPNWDCDGTCYQKVEAAENVFSQDINNSKFIPYIQLHEFEGLLFTSPKVVSATLGRAKAEILQSIQRISNAFATPEEINEGDETHPSKRLTKLFPNYNKPVFGSIIAQRTGLDTIRKSCPHFNGWVTKLLAL